METKTCGPMGGLISTHTHLCHFKPTKLAAQGVRNGLTLVNSIQLLAPGLRASPKPGPFIHSTTFLNDFSHRSHTKPKLPHTARLGPSPALRSNQVAFSERRVLCRSSLASASARRFRVKRAAQRLGAGTCSKTDIYQTHAPFFGGGGGGCSTGNMPRCFGVVYRKA